MPMKEETWHTPLRCANNHRYEEQVLWKIHYVEDVIEPTNQAPEIRELCRHCGFPVEVANGWLPYPR
jgi:hypothetical protein